MENTIQLIGSVPVTNQKHLYLYLIISLLTADMLP